MSAGIPFMSVDIHFMSTDIHLLLAVILFLPVGIHIQSVLLTFITVCTPLMYFFMNFQGSTMLDKIVCQGICKLLNLLFFLFISVNAYLMPLWRQVIWSLLFLAMAFVATCGNLIVIWIVLSDMRLRRKYLNYFIGKIP